MAEATLSKIDVIDELRYRRWARENYVTPAERNEQWHPVILEEMRKKDDEGITATVAQPKPRSATQPLGLTRITTQLMACVGFSRFDAGV
jgi:hypothetical protein